MNRSKPITADGRARVEAALNRHGMLLQQGQWEIPSVADLVEGRPITTKGFSWDYVPAWNLTEELAERPDVATAKLFRGRTTLVLDRLWPAVGALAQAARSTVLDRESADPHKLILRFVEGEPGVSGDAIKTALGIADSRRFQRLKNDLTRWLSLVGREQIDVEHHTHDKAWFPWAAGKIGGADSVPMEVEEAVATLLDGVYPDGRPSRGPRVATLLPVVKCVVHGRR